MIRSDWYVWNGCFNHHLSSQELTYLSFCIGGICDRSLQGNYSTLTVRNCKALVLFQSTRGPKGRFRHLCWTLLIRDEWTTQIHLISYWKPSNFRVFKLFFCLFSILGPTKTSRHPTKYQNMWHTKLRHWEILLTTEKKVQGQWCSLCILWSYRSLKAGPTGKINENADVWKKRNQRFPLSEGKTSEKY